MKKSFFFGKALMVCAFMTVANQSCTNLDEEVYGDLTDATFPKTDEENIAALGAAYTSLYFYAGHNSYHSMQEVSTDEVMIPQRGADWYDGGNWLRCHRHEFTSTDEYNNNAWGDLFRGVSTCNRLIEFFQLNVENSEAYVAELRTLRALYYSWALNAWGNVPIETRFQEADPTPPTKSKAEVYDFIEQELVEASALLPKDVTAATYGRMNYYVAQAILSRLYLNAERYTGTAQLDKCIAACDEVINSGKYPLAANYFANFNVASGDNGEIILAIPYDRVYAKGFILPQMTLHYGSQFTFNLQEQPWNGYCTLTDFYNSYDNADTRKKNFLAGPQFRSDGSVLEDPGADDPDGTPLNFTPEINEHFPNCYRQAGARIAKWEFESGQNRDNNNDFALFRLGEILLNKAEALWRKNAGDANALDLVNQIRSRAGVPAFASLTADNLLAERGREMFYEGVRRADLIRFGKFGEATQFKPADAGTHLQWFPIPQPQLNSNPNLVQNDGY